MKRMEKIKTIFIVVVASTCFLTFVRYSQAGDSWYIYYEKGLDFLKASQWKEAVENFEKALEREKKPAKMKKTYGMHYIQYYPYLNIGIAYYHLGRLQEAVTFLNKSKIFGIAPDRKINDYVQKSRSRSMATPSLKNIPDTPVILDISGPEIIDIERDGVIMSGESVEFRVTLSNKGKREIEDIEVILGSNSSSLKITPGQIVMNILPSHQRKDMKFIMDIPENFRTRNVKLYLDTMVKDKIYQSRKLALAIKNAFDSTPPRIVLSYPLENTEVVIIDSAIIQGKIEDEENLEGCLFLLNNEKIDKKRITIVKAGAGTIDFSCIVKELGPGGNMVHIIARDIYGNTAKETINFIYHTDSYEALDHLDRGKRYYREARYEMALKELRISQDLLLTNERMCEAFLYVGFIRIALGEEARAKSQFKEALQFYPDKALDPEVYSPRIIKLFNECKNLIRQK